jgi:3-methyl-2-oxobutanoate hydroxymethyltransferase
MAKTWTTARIKALKGESPFACLTAYDYTMARLIDAAEIPMILVGDSLGMTMQGHATTLPVSMEDMLYHTRAVARGVSSALVVADMPFMSYQVSIEQGMTNAGRFLKEAGAGAVKVEGGALRRELVTTLVANGIPVLGHIGLTPQSVHQMGGFKVQGKQEPDAAQLIEDARILVEAGAFALVLECVPAELGRAITAAVSIPTIGIGAGSGCDGQILVTHDLLGFSGDFAPRFVKRYAELGNAASEAIAAYRSEVSQGLYPAPEHGY